MAKATTGVVVPKWDSIGALSDNMEQVEVIKGFPGEYSFEELVRLKHEAKQEKEEAERKEKACSDALLMFMLQAEVDKVELWDGWTFDRREGRGASKIDSTKLLEAGVPLATIRDATVEGKPYTYVQITIPKAVTK